MHTWVKIQSLETKESNIIEFFLGASSSFLHCSNMLLIFELFFLTFFTIFRIIRHFCNFRHSQYFPDFSNFSLFFKLIFDFWLELFHLTFLSIFHNVNVQYYSLIFVSFNVSQHFFDFFNIFRHFPAFSKFYIVFRIISNIFLMFHHYLFNFFNIFGLLNIS